MRLRPLTNGRPYHRLGQAPAKTSSHIPCTRSPNLIPDLKSLDRPRRSGWRIRWTMTATMHVKTTLKIVSTTIAYMDEEVFKSGSCQSAFFHFSLPFLLFRVPLSCFRVLFLLSSLQRCFCVPPAFHQIRFLTHLRFPPAQSSL